MKFIDWKVFNVPILILTAQKIQESKNNPGVLLAVS
jgi:hypothetical protein